MATVGLVTHPVALLHDPGAGHPERPGRLRAVLDRFEEAGLLDELERLEPEPAPEEAILALHDPALLAAVRAAVLRADSGPVALDGDTAVSPASLEAALRASGGLIAACDRIRAGEWKRAFSAMRPPGHHAEEGRAMGFCLFNHVAVAAEHLLGSGLERVAIVDWDVHHGNGTQHLFEERADVFYASLHQWPLYPGTGAASEVGRGPGRGTTLNRPMPAGSRDADWLREVEERVLPALAEFRPDFLLVSAGFDAHRLDPLAGCDLTEDAYRGMTRLLSSFADEVCGGRIACALEGGYHLEALASSALACVEELRA